MSEEWGPWIEHDGKGCPCPGNFVEMVVVHARFRVVTQTVLREWEAKYCGVAGQNGGGSWNWANYPELAKVVRYRIRKPRGMEILEEVLAKLPAPKEPVDA